MTENSENSKDNTKIDVVKGQVNVADKIDINSQNVNNTFVISKLSASIYIVIIIVVTIAGTKLFDVITDSYIGSEKAIAERDIVAGTQSDSSAVLSLLAKGGDINQQDSVGLTPLFRATRKNNLALAKALIESGADVNIKSNSGDTALTAALKKKHFEIASLLIPETLNLHEFKKSEDSMFYTAIRSNNEDIVRQVWDTMVSRGGGYKTSIARHEFDPLDIAAMYHSSPGIVDFLFDKKAYQKLDKIVLAITKNNLPMIEHLIKLGEDINQFYYGTEHNAFSYAAKIGNVEAAKILVKFGAKTDIVTSDNRTAMHIASSNGNDEFIEYLVGLGFDVSAANGTDDEHALTPLYYAVKNLRYNTAETLIRNGANVNHPKESSSRAEVIYYTFHDSDLSNNKESEKLLKLFYRNMDKEMLQKNITSLIGGALILHSKELAKFASSLFDVNSPVYSCSNSNLKYCQPYLHYLASVDKKEDVALFFEMYDVDVNSLDKEGNTALYYAIKFGNLEFAEYLVKMGADINIKTNGLSILQRFTSKDKAVAFLIKHGATK